MEITACNVQRFVVTRCVTDAQRISGRVVVMIAINRPTAAIYGTRSHRVRQFPGLLMGARERSLAERSRARRGNA
jgi:hypothetical protein